MLLWFLQTHHLHSFMTSPWSYELYSLSLSLYSRVHRPCHRHETLTTISTFSRSQRWSTCAHTGTPIIRSTDWIVGGMHAAKGTDTTQHQPVLIIDAVGEETRWLVEVLCRLLSFERPHHQGSILDSHNWWPLGWTRWCTLLLKIGHVTRLPSDSDAREGHSQNRLQDTPWPLWIQSNVIWVV